MMKYAEVDTQDGTGLELKRIDVEIGGGDLTANEELQVEQDTAAGKISWFSPFLFKGYRLLWTTNVAEFTGRTLSEISILVWLYEATGDALALGWLGIITLCVQVPSIPIGGVLADEVDRRVLISTMQAAACATSTILGALCYFGDLRIPMAYLAVGVLQLTSQLENSARGALTASVVSDDVLPRAVSTNVVTDSLGEVLAPILFFAVAGTTDHASEHSLAIAFFIASLSYAIAAVMPLMIQLDVEARASNPGLNLAGDGGGEDGNSSESNGEGNEKLGEDNEAVSNLDEKKTENDSSDIQNKGENGNSSDDNVDNNNSNSSLMTVLARRYSSLIEGFRYIMGHPLLPGLYALDWGMTLVSFYRELFPLFVAELFTEGRESLGLSERGAVALLTSINFLGGVVGGLITFKAQDCDDHYGRQVVIATLAYAAGCVLFGATRYFLVGALAVFWCGACDAVGATMRNIVVMLTTPDSMRGRARSGHSLAANVANSLGQLYVAAMSTVIGPGFTMILGGVLTVVAVFCSVARIPELLAHHGKSSNSNNERHEDDELIADVSDE